MSDRMRPEDMTVLRGILKQAEEWQPKRRHEIKPRPLPGFERYANVGSYKRPNRHVTELHKQKAAMAKAEEPNGPLDALNDSLPIGVTLHPTKGWRNRSERSLRADLLHGEIRHDIRAWFRTWMP